MLIIIQIKVKTALETIRLSEKYFLLDSIKVFIFYASPEFVHKVSVLHKCLSKMVCA